jgi:hypothetical protein
MVSSTLLTLIVIPAVYSLWKESEIKHLAARSVALAAPSVGLTNPMGDRPPVT